MELQSLARRALGGDKLAQFELGDRMEKGRGLPVNIERARMLYKQAAGDTINAIPIWSPGFNKVPGRVILVDQGVRVPGLIAARERLMRLDQELKSR